MTICIAPVERATDGPCEMCGFDHYEPRVHDMRVGGQRGLYPKEGAHAFLGLPTRLCLHEGGEHFGQHTRRGTWCGLCPTQREKEHAYQEGEWCSLCGGNGDVCPVCDIEQASSGSRAAEEGDHTNVSCPTCLGFKAVASVEVSA